MPVSNHLVCLNPAPPQSTAGLHSFVCPHIIIQPTTEELNQVLVFHREFNFSEAWKLLLLKKNDYY